MDPAEKNQAETNDVSSKEFYQMVCNSMREGQTKSDIVWNLTQNEDEGFDRAPVLSAVDKVYNQIAVTALKEKFMIGSFLPSILGGVIAAIIAGFFWGLMVKITEYEIGYAAIGVGWLCAYGVLFFNEEKKGLPAQVIACLCSIMGIIIGKYFIYYFVLKAMLVEQYSQLFASRIALLAEDTFRGFPSFFIESVLQGGNGIMDLLWLSLALGSAWRITKGLTLSDDVIAQANVSYESIPKPSLVKSSALVAGGLVVIYFLFGMLSKSPEITFSDITEIDVKAVVKLMKNTEATQAYFEIIPTELVEDLSDVLSEFVTSGIEQKDFIKELERLKTNYENFTIKLSQAGVPDDFEVNREQYPDLMHNVYTFILKEYNLYFYYNFYITYFDKDYVFNLSDDTNKALEIINKSFFTG